jgi:hypothetical protein
MTGQLQEDKGAFKSPLISLALAAHLRLTIGNQHLNEDGYGYPIGALAVATAVVSIYMCLSCHLFILLNQIERGLKLIKYGQVKLYGTRGKSTNASEETAGKKRKVNEYEGYTDSVWGDVTRGWVAAAKRLNPAKLKAVLEAAVAIVDFSKTVEDEEEEVGVNDPRALVEI